MKISVAWLRRFHAVMTVVWLVLAVPSLLWWKDSILWVILLSVWANVASHFGAWQGARAEDAATPDPSSDDDDQPEGNAYTRTPWSV